MAVEDIGARLVIDPGASIETLQALSDEVKKLNASLLELGATAEATMGKVAKSGEAAAVAGGEAAGASTKAGTAAEDAGLVGAGAAGDHVTQLDKVTEATNTAKKATQSFGDAVGVIASGPLGKFGLAAGAAAVVAAGEGIDMYVKYQKAMTQLVTQAGVSAKQLPGLMSGGLQIAAQTGLAFNDVANQLYRIASATSGLKETNKQMLALGQSAANVAVLFRVTPGAPTEQVARLFGSLANAGRSGRLQQVGNTPAQMAALLNAAVGTGDIRGQDLIGALGRGVLQSGQAVGAKLPDILAWLDLSTRLGAQPSTSGTLIAHSLQQIATPSEQGTKAQMMLGIQQGQLQQIMAHQGIGAAVQYLMSSMQKFNPVGNYPAMSGHTAGADSALAQLQAWGMNPSLLSAFQAGTMTPAQQQTLQQFMLTKMFGGARQEIPVLSIAENPQLYASILSEIHKQTNQATYQKDLATALGTPSQQMEIAWRNLELYSIDIGKAITPAAVFLLHEFVNATKFLDSHHDALYALAAMFGSVAAAGLAAYGLDKVFKTMAAFSKMGSAFGTIISKISQLFGGAGQAAAQTPLEAALTLNTGATEQNTLALYGNDVSKLPGFKGTTLPGGLKYPAEEALPEEAAAGELAAGMTLGGAVAGFTIAAIGLVTIAYGIKGLIDTANQPAFRSYKKAQQAEKANPQNQVGWSGMVAPIDLSKPFGKKTPGGGTSLLGFSNLAQAEAYMGSGGTGPTSPGIGANLSWAAKEQGRASILQSQLAHLNTIGDYLGTNSPQYKAALGLYLENAKAFGITSKTKAMTSGALQTEVNTAEWNSYWQEKQAQKNLFLSAVGGGTASVTQGKINRTEYDIKQAKAYGETKDNIDALKDQLKQEQSHLKNIESLQAKLTKAQDTENQTRTLQQTTKTAADTTNNLLGRILTAINQLQKTNPGLTINGMPTTTNNRNLTGAGT